MYRPSGLVATPAFHEDDWKLAPFDGKKVAPLYLPAPGEAPPYGPHTRLAANVVQPVAVKWVHPASNAVEVFRTPTLRLQFRYEGRDMIVCLWRDATSGEQLFVYTWDAGSSRFGDQYS